MTNHPATIGELLEQVLERVVFADPLTHRIREEWEETKREVQALFERDCTKEYELRLNYHRACGEPNAEGLARQDATLIRPMLAEKREHRLTLVWTEILRRAQAVMAGKADVAAETTPCTDGGDDAGDSSDT
jgi:hypothetical protein